jgi:hypothetical protein
LPNRIVLLDLSAKPTEGCDVPLSVLFVECPADGVIGIADGLRREGFDVSAVPDTFAALDLLNTAAWFDVLITRVRPHRTMPHGFALARMALSRRPHLRAIFLTRFEVPEDEQRTAAGPILIEPVTAEDVIREVRKLAMA